MEIYLVEFFEDKLDKHVEFRLVTTGDGNVASPVFGKRVERHMALGKQPHGRVALGLEMMLDEINRGYVRQHQTTRDGVA
jgi:predicted SpoU family rRNA methylase